MITKMKVLFLVSFATGAMFLAGTMFLTGTALAEQASPCADCHQKIMPAIYDQWAMSRHYAAKVGCEDCHATELSPEQGSFLHYDRQLSLIVSPKVCARCHGQEFQEFSRSAHARAYECVSTAPCAVESPGKSVIGCGKLFINDYEGNAAGHAGLPPFGLTADSGALAAGINGCWQCHGSVVKVLAGGKPDPATWPNAGIGRINPDGSRGNCASCHQRHTFSVAEARRPELCGGCHNQAGGDPQLEIYNLSRHGTTYQQNIDKMNLESPRWVVGEDYSVAPTCATCHLSANPDMPVTHNVDERILNRTAKPDKDLFTKLEIARQITCRCGPDFCTHCQVGDAEWINDYCQIDKFPGDEPRQHMGGVCQSCHSGVLIDNYRQQYLQEVDLIMSKWIDPGRRLYILATRVLEAAQGEQYAQIMSPVASAWSSICNHDAKYSMYAAAMMSPGFTQQSSGAISGDWYDAFVPALASLIDANRCSQGPQVKALAQELEKAFCDTLANPTYGGGWRHGKGANEPDPDYCYNFIAKDPCKD